MPVSGLVVSVVDEESAGRVRELLSQDDSFTLGEQIGLRLAVAANAADGQAAERRHEWVRQLPGVVKVDVAFVFMGAEEASDAR